MNEEISVRLLNLRENAECGVAQLYKLAGWLPDEESDYSKIKLRWKIPIAPTGRSTAKNGRIFPLQYPTA